MRRINLAVWHCSADRENHLKGKGRDYLDRVAKQRGFREVSYHIIILADGSIEYGRDVWEKGAHAKGYNTISFGVVYIGGLDKNGKPKDTRTPEQKKTMRMIKQNLDYHYPGIKHVGHRDLSVDLNGDGVISKNEWMKACPCFDVATEL